LGIKRERKELCKREKIKEKEFFSKKGLDKLPTICYNMRCE
jgi:hypothetical protein